MDSALPNACGLDFGTSNSAVALPDGRVLAIDPRAEASKLFRSVLYFPEETRESYAGAEAIELYLEEVSGRFIQSVKSWLPSKSFHATQIHNRAFKLVDLVALLLRQIRTRAEKACGQELTRVVMGRPAVFSPEPENDALAEARLKEAAVLAGFKEIVFLIEPIAAALAYEAGLDREQTVLVGDFGAGTSDFTLMKLGPDRRFRRDRQEDVIASGGVRVGGDNFDSAIMRHKLLPSFGAGSQYKIHEQWLPMPNHIVHRLLSWREMSFIRDRSTQELLSQMVRTSDRPDAIQALQDLVMENLGFQLFRAIEACKVQLSKGKSGKVVFDEARIQLDVTVTRDEFEGFCAPLLESLASCVDDVMARAGANRVDAVFLTGGTSYIPSVRRVLEERFGKERIHTADAFASVCEGLGRGAGWMLAA